MRAKISLAAIALVVAAAGFAPAWASIEFAAKDDVVILHDGPGGRGGVFYADVVGKTSDVAPYLGSSPKYDFPTFCVEIFETISLGKTYTVASLSTQSMASNKNLGSFAAWLYTKFLEPIVTGGTGLTTIVGKYGVLFDMTSAKDMNAVQYGIWKSMGYSTYDITHALSGGYDEVLLANLRTAYSNDNAWSDGVADQYWNEGTEIGRVKIMNLIGPGSKTKNAQDQLIWCPPEENSQLPPVPEPMSFAVWSLLAISVGFVNVRRSR